MSFILRNKILHLLSPVKVCPPVLQKISASYGTPYTTSCYLTDVQNLKSLISQVRLAGAEKRCKFPQWIAFRANCTSEKALNASTKVCVASTESLFSDQDVDITSPHFNSKNGQMFSRSCSLPRHVKLSPALYCTTNFSEWTKHALGTQILRTHTRCYSTHVLNCKNISKTKFSGRFREFNFSNPPLRENARSKSSSSIGYLKTSKNVAEYISGEASSVLVMTGAGLSTASGIPDFRSPSTGIYDNLQKYDLPYPEAIFDIQFFMMDPRPFVALAQELYPGLKFRPNAGHRFIRLLQDKGKLRRVYTQNIDGLERLSGIHEEKLLEAHGSFASASCTLCRAAHDPELVKQSILCGPGVPACGVRGCKGKVKPDIVFFGENLPEEFWRFEEDLHAVDLVLIIGTSLEVYPFASIADSARNVTPRVLINRTGAGSIGMRPKDCILEGDIVETVTELARLCGWQRELDELGRLT